MSGCTETGKPQISILMAVYEPRMDWLREQLLSLDAQTYSNIKLYIRDDCSPTVPFEAIQSCVRDCIRAFPYEIKRNEKNLGSNGTFELLTQEADGEYFAYCDQDDVWRPEKLDKLHTQLEREGTDLICGDVFLIDETGREFAGSITRIRPRHVFVRGENAARTLLYRNYVIGCTTLIRSTCAKAALPFVGNMVHDHYLAFFCACNGLISVSDEPLVNYRIHENNQTGVMAQVTDRASYCACRVEPFYRRIKELSGRFELEELSRAAKWAQARMDHVGNVPGAIRELWRLREVDKATTLFELVVFRFPRPLFRAVVRLIQAGKI